MPTASSKPPAEAEAAAPDPRDARIAELEEKLATLQRPTVSVTGQAVRLKVEAPHSELHYAGHKVGTEFTEVPANLAASFMEAAADAGVTLTQDMEG